jgi:WbqC-like protein family
MKTAIMQPYFLPYIGYFQLIHAVDQFVIYDNIQYTKKGWINRNRILQNGKDEFITLPLKKDSDFLNVCQRELADGFSIEAATTLRKIGSLYRKAPQYDVVFPLLEQLYTYPNRNLFDFIHHSVLEICRYLGINTPIIASSTVPIDHQLKSEDKVIALCKALNTKMYINPIGGLDLYSGAHFEANGIQLYFQKARMIEYQQFNHAFVPWLSILDVMMFNHKSAIQEMLNHYDITPTL